MVIQQTISEKLQQAFTPLHLEVDNESHQHSVPENSETHFRVVLVCEAFATQRKVARHQSVYAALADELAGPVHALALHTYSPQEWGELTGGAPQSPACLGGSKHEQTGNAS